MYTSKTMMPLYYNYHNYYFAPEFFIPTLTNGFSLTSEWPQVSRTLLSILTDLNSVVVRMVLILPLICNSFNLLAKPLETIPSTPSTIGITITFTFHSYFSSLARSKYLSIFSSFIFTLWSAGTAKSIR